MGRRDAAAARAGRRFWLTITLPIAAPRGAGMPTPRHVAFLPPSLPLYSLRACIPLFCGPALLRLPVPKRTLRGVGLFCRRAPAVRRAALMWPWAVYSGQQANRVIKTQTHISITVGWFQAMAAGCFHHACHVPATLPACLPARTPPSATFWDYCCLPAWFTTYTLPATCTFHSYLLPTYHRLFLSSHLPCTHLPVGHTHTLPPCHCLPFLGRSSADIGSLPLSTCLPAFTHHTLYILPFLPFIPPWILHCLAHPAYSSPGVDGTWEHGGWEGSGQG